MGLETALQPPPAARPNGSASCAAPKPPPSIACLGRATTRKRGQLAFSKDEEEPLDAQAIIVDEVSMVDIPLMAALLRAMKNECRLVLVGDRISCPAWGRVGSLTT